MQYAVYNPNYKSQPNLLLVAFNNVTGLTVNLLPNGRYAVVLCGAGLAVPEARIKAHGKGDIMQWVSAVEEALGQVTQQSNAVRVLQTACAALP